MHNGSMMLNVKHMIIWMHWSYDNGYQKEKLSPKTPLTLTKQFYPQNVGILLLGKERTTFWNPIWDKCNHVHTYDITNTKFPCKIRFFIQHNLWNLRYFEYLIWQEKWYDFIQINKNNKIDSNVANVNIKTLITMGKHDSKAHETHWLQPKFLQACKCTSKRCIMEPHVFATLNTWKSFIEHFIIFSTNLDMVSCMHLNNNNLASSIAFMPVCMASYTTTNYGHATHVF
jgi:hypothetical protein